MFKLKKIRTFATEQITQLEKKIPAQTLVNQAHKVSIGKTTQALEQFYQQATSFKNENKLGFIGISLLSNSLKWELKNKNYPENFIEMAIEGLIVNLFKK
jgi:hypothetical protein